MQELTWAQLLRHSLRRGSRSTGAGAWRFCSLGQLGSFGWRYGCGSTERLKTTLVVHCKNYSTSAAIPPTHLLVSAGSVFSNTGRLGRSLLENSSLIPSGGFI